MKKYHGKVQAEGNMLDFKTLSNVVNFYTNTPALQ